MGRRTCQSVLGPVTIERSNDWTLILPAERAVWHAELPSFVADRVVPAFASAPCATLLLAGDTSRRGLLSAIGALSDSGLRYTIPAIRHPGGPGFVDLTLHIDIGAVAAPAAIRAMLACDYNLFLVIASTLPIKPAKGDALTRSDDPGLAAAREPGVSSVLFAGHSGYEIELMSGEPSLAERLLELK